MSFSLLVIIIKQYYDYFCETYSKVNLKNSPCLIRRQAGKTWGRGRVETVPCIFASEKCQIEWWASASQSFIFYFFLFFFLLALQPFWALDYFQFHDLFTIGRTPWTSDQLVASVTVLPAGKDPLHIQYADRWAPICVWHLWEPEISCRFHEQNPNSTTVRIVT
jgi:hypothetical protein